jgi:hypothetical protein
MTREQILQEINDILEVAQNEVEDDLDAHPLAQCKFPTNGEIFRLSLIELGDYVNAVNELCDRLKASIDSYKEWAQGCLEDRAAREKPKAK